MSAKVSSQQWNLPLTTSISWSECEWKKYVEKRLLTMFLTEDKVLMGWRHWSKYQCDEISNFVDLYNGVDIVWSTTTPTRIIDANAVTFSVKCLGPLKLYPVSGNIFRKWFASYFLFIHEHLVIMWSPTVTFVAVTTLLLTSGLYRC